MGLKNPSAILQLSRSTDTRDRALRDFYENLHLQRTVKTLTSSGIRNLIS